MVPGRMLDPAREPHNPARAGADNRTWWMKEPVDAAGSEIPVEFPPAEAGSSVKTVRRGHAASNPRPRLAGGRRGEPAALADVYRHYAPALFQSLERGFRYESAGKRFFLRGLTQPWELENAVHETFLRALTPAARASYELNPFHAYLLGIARNLLIDHARSSRVEVLSLEEFAVEPVEGLSAPPSPAVSRDDRHASGWRSPLVLPW
ncbi:MAG: RNA polymerase sigma factor [Myxococcaceae bacterium]